MANLDELKIYLRDEVEATTKHSAGKAYVCPLCGSGTGAHRTGAFSIDSDGTRWKCFSCGEGGDIYDLFEKRDGLTSSEAARAVMEKYGKAGARPAAAPGPAAAQKPAGDLAADITRYAAALEGSAGQSYLQGRGLTLDTMRRFNLGYNAQRGTVTIPYNPQGSYYGQRSIDPNATGKHFNLPGVTIPLFNAAALYSSDVCFVVESPICAISITQEGGAAVAISGTGGAGRLLDQLKKKPTNAALVLCLDNDDAGRKATEEVGAALEEINAFCVDGTAVIMGAEQNKQAAEYRKDPNEVLQRSGAETLRKAVEETTEEARRQHSIAAQEADAERQQRTGAGMVDTFLQVIQSRKYEPMPTGITDIDKAIGGGFIRQQLVLLGAAPGAGKTALAQWIFEGMAKRGTACVYLNLEMSREQILARSIARLAAVGGQTIRPTAILQGYDWTDAQRAAILNAAEEYKSTIAPRMIYNPDGVTANLGSILAYIETEAQRAEKAEAPAPCVVLDYLQIVNGDPREDAASVIKRAVAGLKEYAIRHNTLVFVIIAHNRTSNSTGNVSMESGRDTSALEYGADLQLALTYTKCVKRKGQPQKNPDDLTDEERKNITLRIVKGRFGGMGREVDLFFNGETMTYTQLAKGFTVSSEPTPFEELKRRGRL